MKKIIILSSCFVALLIIIQALEECHQANEGTVAQNGDSRFKPLSPKTSRIFRPNIVHAVDGFESDQLDTLFRPVHVAAGLNSESNAWISEKLRFEPQFALKCIAYLKGETNIETARILAKLIVENCDTEALSLFKQASTENLAEDDPNKRRIGLMMLMDTPSIQFEENQAELCRIVGGIAQTDADQQVRLDAILTLQVWLHENSSIQSQVAEEIVQSIGSATDGSVRTRGYQALAIQGVLFSSDILQEISNLLQNESDFQNINLGIQAMGSAANDAKGFAVDQLERIYLGTNDREKKLAIAGEMVEIGEFTIDRLKQISSNDPWLIGELQSRLKATRLERSN